MNKKEQKIVIKEKGKEFLIRKVAIFFIIMQTANGFTNPTTPILKMTEAKLIVLKNLAEPSNN